MLNENYEIKIEVVASDGQWTIGYICGDPAIWEGNNEENPEVTWMNMDEFSCRDETEFFDGTGGCYVVESGEWVEVSEDAVL